MRTRKHRFTIRFVSIRIVLLCLKVEGGLIDQAHHKNYARLALGESAEFDKAVEVAINMTGPDTLIIVTADHSHAFTMNGYAKRGNDILGEKTLASHKSFARE